MTLCVWLYRKVVIAPWSPKVPKFTKDQFGKGMAALSAANDYLEYLQGRVMSDRDRSPCFNRIKSIVVRRLESETGKKMLFPKPAWVSN
jgi:hypothetical protein